MAVQDNTQGFVPPEVVKAQGQPPVSGGFVPPEVLKKNGSAPLGGGESGGVTQSTLPTEPPIWARAPLSEERKAKLREEVVQEYTPEEQKVDRPVPIYTAPTQSIFERFPSPQPVTEAPAPAAFGTPIPRRQDRLLGDNAPIFDRFPVQQQEEPKPISKWYENYVLTNRGQELQNYIDRKTVENADATQTEMQDLQDDLSNLLSRSVLTESGARIWMTPDLENEFIEKSNRFVKLESAVKARELESQGKGYTLFYNITRNQFENYDDMDSFIGMIKDNMGIGDKPNELLSETDILEIQKRAENYLPYDLYKAYAPLDALSLGLDVKNTDVARAEIDNNIRFEQGHYEMAINTFFNSISSLMTGLVGGAEVFAAPYGTYLLKKSGVQDVLPEGLKGSSELPGWAEDMNTFVNELFPLDPDKQEDFYNMFYSSLGSLAGFMAITYLTGGMAGGGASALGSTASATARVAANARLLAPAALTAALGEGYQQYKRALYATGDEETALRAYWRGWMSGSVQVMPLIGVMNRANKVTGGSLYRSIIPTMLRNGVKSGAEIGLQDVAGTVLRNMSDKQLYDFSREIITAGELRGSFIAALAGIGIGLNPGQLNLSQDNIYLQNQLYSNLRAARNSLLTETPFSEVIRQELGEPEVTTPPTTGQTASATEGGMTGIRIEVPVEEQAQPPVMGEQAAPVIDAEQQARQEIETYTAGLFSEIRTQETLDPVLATMQNAESLDDAQADNALGTIFTEIDRINQDPDLSPETKKALTNQLYDIAEQIDNYEFRATTETTTVTETIATQRPRKAAYPTSTERYFDGQTATVNGQPVSLTVNERGQVVSQTVTPESQIPQLEQRKRDLQAKIDGEVKKERGETVAKLRQEQAQVQQQIDQLQAAPVAEQAAPIVLDIPTMGAPTIEFNEDGSFASITYTDRDGNTLTMDGDAGLDLAIKTRMQEVGEVPEQVFQQAVTEAEQEVTVRREYIRERQTQPSETQQEQAVLEGVRDGRAQEERGQEGTQLRPQEEEVTPSMGAQAREEVTQPVPEQEKIEIAERIGSQRKVTPKNIKGLLDVMGEVFGLNKPQAESAAVIGDIMVGNMAKGEGISKDEMYQRIAFAKAQMKDLPKDVVFQSNKKLNLYHSTTSPISGEFRMQGKNNSWGAYFARTKSASKTFGDVTYKVSIRPKNTLTVNDNEVRKIKFFNIPKEVYEQYRKDGYDSIAWYKNGKLQEFVVLDPKIIEGYDVLFQNNKGAMAALDGKYVIYAITNPNVSTPLHELAHIYEHYLTDAERKAILEWAGHKEWTTETSEKFARGFETYLSEGQAPTPALQKYFDNFKNWLREIYNGIIGSDIDLQLNDKMRSIYDTILSTETVQEQQAREEVTQPVASEVEVAKQRLRDALNNLNIQGIAALPEQQAARQKEVIDAVAGLAKVYIKQGVKTVEEFIQKAGDALQGIGRDLIDQGWASSVETPIVSQQYKDALVSEKQKLNRALDNVRSNTEYNDIQQRIAEIDQILNLSTEATRQDVTENPQKYGYHGGTLAGKSDYLSIGYTGEQPYTGYYFFSDVDRAIRLGDRASTENVAKAVDFSQYNLLKPTTSAYWELKGGLKKLPSKLAKGESVEEILTTLRRFVPDIGFSPEFNSENLQSWYKEWSAIRDANFATRDFEKSKTERFETFVLKQLGYEGVDVRNLKPTDMYGTPDKFAEGSVIFDLKPNTVVDISDMYGEGQIKSTPGIETAKQKLREAYQAWIAPGFAATPESIAAKNKRFIDALVNLAKAYIAEGVKTAKEFAAKTGLSIRDARVIMRAAETGESLDVKTDDLQRISSRWKSTVDYEESLTVGEKVKQGFEEYLSSKQAEAKQKLTDLKQQMQTRVDAAKDKAKATATAIKSRRQAMFDLIQKDLKDVPMDGLRKSEFNRILNNLKNAVSDRQIDKAIDTAYGLFSDAGKRRVYNILGKLRDRANTNIGKGKLGVVKPDSPFRQIVNISPEIVPGEVINVYRSILEEIGARQAVLPVKNRQILEEDINFVLSAVQENIEYATVLRDAYNDYAGKGTYAENLQAMLEEGVITPEQFEFMKANKNMILEKPTVEREIDEIALEEERQVYIELLKDAVMPKQVNGVDADSNDIVRFFNSLTESDLEALSLPELKQLANIYDNFNAGFVPHLANLLRNTVDANRRAEKVADVTKNYKGDLLSFSAKLSAALRGTSYELQKFRKNPVVYIDQAVNNFKNNNIYRNLFQKMGAQYSALQSDQNTIAVTLNKAIDKLSKNPRTQQQQTALISFYNIQKEFEDNPGNSEVAPVSAWLEATIKDSESIYDENSKAMLQELFDKYATDGEFDLQKAWAGFTPAMREAYESLVNLSETMIRPKAEHTASMKRGQPIRMRDSYAHIPLVRTGRDVNMENWMNGFYRPSTKSHALTPRTGKTHATLFDPFWTFNRSARMTLTDYYLTDEVRTVQKALNNLIKNSDGRQKEVHKDLKSVFNELLENTIAISAGTDSTAEKYMEEVMKKGYQAQLSSLTRATAEATSNYTFALLYRGESIAASFPILRKYGNNVLSAAMQSLGSTQSARLYSAIGSANKNIDFSTADITTIKKVTGFDSKTAAALKQLNNETIKRLYGGIDVVATFILTRPDQMVARQLWFGEFARRFKALTGQEANFEKFAENDATYMDKYRDAIADATNQADNTITQAVASSNPFDGIAQNQVKPSKNFIVALGRHFNTYLTRFARYEFNAANRAVHSLWSNGLLSKADATRLLVAVTTRNAVYLLMTQHVTQLVWSAIASALGFDVEDEEKQFDSRAIQRSIFSTVVQLAVFRNLGNVQKVPLNFIVEAANVKFGENYTYEGEYDPYHDNIAYPLIPLKMEEIMKPGTIVNSSLGITGAYSPLLRALYRGGQATQRAVFSKRPETREKYINELMYRTTTELVGTIFGLPFYKDIRGVMMKIMYKTDKQVKDAARSNARQGTTRQSTTRQSTTRQSTTR